MKKIKYLLGICLMVASSSVFAQGGLEGIVIERYYQADAADVASATANGAVTPLTTNSITYRIYVDMAAGYKFTQLYGTPTHNLSITSTANFFNDPDYGVSVDPYTISSTNIAKKTAMIDTWLACGGASSGKVGVVKGADTDGSVGNVNSVLANNPGTCFGSAITGIGSRDGMVPGSASTYVTPNTLGLGAALNAFDQTAGNSVVLTNGAIAALGGIVGANATNLVLIGQFTTTGSISYDLNVQVVKISTGVAENYVSSSPVNGEFTHPTLSSTIQIGCPTEYTVDSPLGASNVLASPNMYYPNCYPINGNTSTSTDSPESATFTGPDAWYKFVAQSTGASITLSSATMDDAIALYSKSGNVYTLIDSENSSSGTNDFERLNTNALTPNNTYYLSVGAASGVTGGAFTLCIQHLMPSGCASVVPAVGFSLCDNYKALYRGSTAQGVSYGFTFNGLGGGASGTTSVSGTAGTVPLSNATLALRYGGIYNARVDATYALQPSTGGVETITINGSTSSANCGSIFMVGAPSMEVKSTQRCPATLSRTAYLIGNPVSGAINACGALNYTFEFTQVTDCTGATTSGLPFEVTTPTSSPFLPLGAVFPTALPNTGFYKVRIRTNFSYGAGSYGSAPYWVIQVTGASASVVMPESNESSATERAAEVSLSTAIYPNPNSGEMLHVNMSDITSDKVQVRVLDAIGKVVFVGQYSVDGSLNTVITFENTLQQGIYTVEFVETDKKVVEKFVVQK